MDALLSQSASSLLVCSIYEDQRPLKGAAGHLDWRLKGFLSRFVMGGRITGSPGEFVYVPVKRHDSIRHLLLVGLGHQGAQAQPPEADLIAKLAKRVAQLQFKRVVVSRSSFPGLDENKIAKALKGVEVEFTE
ncbi:MAG: hypothetical protein HY075_14515 [Deltaproteobacteria bacterium]|nr:hypothetical protein [Deltaproteobacteria bacterium]